LQQVDLSGANLQGADLSGSNAAAIRLNHANARNSIWINARLEYAMLNDTDFSNADLRNAWAGGALGLAILDNAMLDDASSGTTQNRRGKLPQITLYFNVSQDEEHVTLKVEVANQIIDLHERAHHYCLLLLARQRLSDADLGVTTDAQGWISMGEFSKILGLDPSHINIHIHRARLQLFQAIPEATAWPNLVERGQNRIRFGPYTFDVNSN
jgi:Pentapeptide repeats (8 copies)